MGWPSASPPRGGQTQEPGGEEEQRRGFRDRSEGDAADLPRGNEAGRLPRIVSWCQRLQRDQLELGSRRRDDPKKKGATLRAHACDITRREARNDRTADEESEDVRREVLGIEWGHRDHRAKGRESEAGRHVKREALVAPERPSGLCAHGQPAGYA